MSGTYKQNHSHLSSLHQIKEHDNHSTLPVMYHLPEISDCGLHGTLSNNEGTLLLVTLHGMNLKNDISYIHINSMNVILCITQHYTPVITCRVMSGKRKHSRLVAALQKLCAYQAGSHHWGFWWGSQELSSSYSLLDLEKHFQEPVQSAHNVHIILCAETSRFPIQHIVKQVTLRDGMP